MVPERTSERELWFDFWGAVTHVVVPTENDERHLAYYFQDYVTKPADRSDVRVDLSTLNAGDDYMTAAADRRSVRLTTPDGHAEYLCGDETVYAPTPLPPFTVEPLSGTVTTVHAAAATPPHQLNSAALIHGPSTSGKSSLLIALMRRGWGFLSDDTVPIDAAGRALPFTRPIGIRQRTAERLGISIAEHADAPRYATSLGTTLSIHPAELGWQIAQRAAVRWVVTLQPSGSFNAGTAANGNLRIELDIEQHETEAIRAIEEFCRG
ncbi:hypothetical protein DEJ01_09865 [Curtobacterium sp. MCLR17_040]|uniref:hypothetical protein n=1 Tax=Curtobacterium sp. MCLR17_040 TaxID=2175625 RepID=UPI000DA8B772|nr:hypothetical protein [Curtobacterium sp. MCLR17_040]PZF02823.1 hypothetical protein DEJ01_09865 [Curtobacterium sp. MCLR17_040]